MNSLIRTVTILILAVVNTYAVEGQAISQHKKNIAMAVRMGTIEQQWNSKREFEKSRCSIELNASLFSPMTVTEGDRIEIMLPDGNAYMASVSRVTTDVNNTFSFMAEILGSEYGYFSLSSRNGISLGTIELPEARRRFSITFDRSSNVQRLIELDPLGSDSLQCAPPLVNLNEN
ncbi:MAG: hypothetical protein HBSIN02_23000 [Bacteroidia bacterium]|nr:MAG: hypothetical protein HBSIN02_23000 [Bacteroidia bacterium]